MDMTRGGFVGKPHISSLDAHTINFYLSTSLDEGAGTPTQSTVSLGDIRFTVSTENFASPASDYTVNSLRVLNTTRFSDVPQNYTELITTPLQMDSVVDFAGLDILYIFFDDSSPMDDINMGSASGHPQAHDGGASNNVFKFVLTFEHSRYEGEATLSKEVSLQDSDA